MCGGRDVVTNCYQKWHSLFCKGIGVYQFPSVTAWTHPGCLLIGPSYDWTPTRFTANMIVVDAGDVPVTDDVGTAMDDGPGMARRNHGQVRQKELCGKFLCQCTRLPMLLLWGECTECVGGVPVLFCGWSDGNNRAERDKPSRRLGAVEWC